MLDTNSCIQEPSIIVRVLTFQVKRNDYENKDLPSHEQKFNYNAENYY